MWLTWCMALIRTLTHITKDRQTRHREADGGWSVVTADSETYFQLDTYGSDERQQKSTISQSIQLDREQASVLVKALRQTFPGI